jgi:hypothetical protein
VRAPPAADGIKDKRQLVLSDWYTNYGAAQSRYALAQPIELAAGLSVSGGSVDPFDALLLQWDKWHTAGSRNT